VKNWHVYFGEIQWPASHGWLQADRSTCNYATTHQSDRFTTTCCGLVTYMLQHQWQTLSK